MTEREKALEDIQHAKDSEAEERREMNEKAKKLTYESRIIGTPLPPDAEEDDETLFENPPKRSARKYSTDYSDEEGFIDNISSKLDILKDADDIKRQELDLQKKRIDLEEKQFELRQKEFEYTREYNEKQLALDREKMQNEYKERMDKLEKEHKEKLEQQQYNNSVLTLLLQKNRNDG